MPRNKTFRFTGVEDFSIFCRRWYPNGEPRAALVIIHGYAEHSGRYQHVAEYFVALDYVVYAFDLQGHGQSEGVRADVVRFEDYLSDLRTFLGIVKEQEPGRQVFVAGHSLGGAIATLYAARYGKEFDGLVTSGVGILVMGHWLSILVKLVRIFDKLVPPLLPVVPVPVTKFSRDPQVVSGYRSDPLNYTGGMRARMGIQLLRASELIAMEAPNITLPVLFLHGAADCVVSPGASQMLYEHVSSEDRTVCFYDGLYHEVFNEPEQEQVLADVADWLDAHVG